MRLKYKLPILIIPILLVFLFGIGTSYSLYKVINEDSDYYTYDEFCLSFILSNPTYNNKLYVMDDTNGITSESYLISITNNCDVDRELELRLSLTDKNKISPEDLKVYMQGNIEMEPTLFNSLVNSSSKNKENITDSKILTTLTVPKGKTIRTNIRTWLDEYSTYKEQQYLDAVIEIKTEKTFIKPVFKETILGSNLLNTKLDPKGKSYYFKGNDINNYVSFANQLFRIVRVNGDGSIRLVLADNYITDQYSSTYNNTNDLLFTYEKDEEQINNNIKTILDTWYDTNLSEYKQYIHESSYCNDIKLWDNKDIYGVDYFISKERLSNNKPTLECSTNEDKIGLLSIDEVMLSKDESGSSYLLNNTSFYTSSPAKYQYGTSYIYYVNNYGNIAEIATNRQSGIRPVINLNNNVTVSGTGTIEDPYTVDKLED